MLLSASTLIYFWIIVVISILALVLCHEFWRLKRSVVCHGRLNIVFSAGESRKPSLRSRGLVSQVKSQSSWITRERKKDRKNLGHINVCVKETTPRLQKGINSPSRDYYGRRSPSPSLTSLVLYLTERKLRVDFLSFCLSLITRKSLSYCLYFVSCVSFDKTMMMMINSGIVFFCIISCNISYTLCSITTKIIIVFHLS